MSDGTIANSRISNLQTVFIKMNGLRVFRKIATAQRRQMSTTEMFENTNKISNVRKTWYSNPETGAANPTYLKEGSDKIVTGAAITMVTFGVLCILKSVNDMSFGINKK